MFGGQDDNAPAAQGGGSSDTTLTGVDDLTSSLNAATAAPMPADPTPSAPDVAPAEAADPAPAPSPAATSDPDGENEELLDLKQQALQQLTPIVGQLDQTPEEKFRTTMMLIQASDNQSLLKEAYEAASAIEDEKLKAQALLDVVNEINYFTQPKQ